MKCGSRPTRPGLYVGQCAEYCGTQHANMLLRVVVDTPDDFERLAGRTSPSRPLTMPAAQAGKSDVSGTVVRQLSPRPRYIGSRYLMRRT